MSGSFTHYLNDQLVEEPKGWRDFTQVIERNEELRFIGLQYEGSVTFYGDGFERLKELYNDSSCQIIAYRVTQDCGDVEATAFEASIIISEIEWNINRCTATTTVADSSYGSYIINNAEITLRPTSEKAKLGTEIEPATWHVLSMFDASSSAPYPGGYSPPNYGPNDLGPAVWDWLDAMSHAVRYMSEGIITRVESDWYTTELTQDDVDAFVITTGYLIRTPTDNITFTFDYARSPLYSFNRLWQNMWKKYDLWSAIETDYNGDIVLRVEQRDYFFGSSVAVSHDDQDNLIQGTDLTQLYGRVKVGSETTIKGLLADASVPFLFLRGFTEEDYHIPIACNTSATLDLITDFVIDSNVIETLLATVVDTYDDDVFLIQYRNDTFGNLYATKGDYILPGQAPQSYNPALLNEAVLERLTLLGAIQYITQETDGFLAEMNTGPAVYRAYTGTFTVGTFTEPVTPQQHRFNQDFPPRGEDPNNNYGNGTAQGSQVSEVNSRYTASQQGLFGFEFQLIWQVFNMSPSLPLTSNKPVALRVIMERYDVSNVLVDTPYDVTSAYTTIEAPNPASLNVFTEPDVPVYMNVDDYVVIKFQFVIGEASVLQPGANDWVYELRVYRSFTPQTGFVSSYWKTNYVAGQGGEIIASVPEDIYQNTFKYVRHIPLEDWLYMVSDPTAYVEVGPGQVPLLPGYARRLARNVNTGNVEIELIAATPNSFLD